jgi:hypothetical protein
VCVHEIECGEDGRARRLGLFLFRTCLATSPLTSTHTQPNRPAALALRAFGAETATIQDAVKEPALAVARFVWWREAGAGVAAGKPPAHPVPRALAAALAGAAARGAPHPTAASLRYRLGRLADARAGLVAEPGPPGTLEALEAYASDTAGGLAALQLGFGLDPATVDGPVAADADHAASHAGTGAGLAAILRGVPHAAARGRCQLPGDVMERAGLDRDALVRLAGSVLGTGGGGEGGAPPPPDPAALAALREATYEVAVVARGHLDAASRLVAGRTLPHPATTPALLPAVGARRYLNALERAGFDPLALAVVHRAGGQGAGGGVGLQLATKWALVTGRV